MTAIGAAETAVNEPNRVIIVFIAMAASVMQVLDTTIANVALPHMQGSLGATQDQIAWVLTSYIVAAAIATPVTGWFAATLGRTRAFVIATTGFTLASIFCGLAMTLPEVVLARILQGVLGAAVVPLAQAIMLDAYSRSEMGKAMSIFSIGVAAVGPILGPIVGGWLTEEYSWRWCFYINVPIGILVVLGALAFVPESGRVPGRKLDTLGFLFLSLAIGCFQLVLDRGEQKGWFRSPEILVEAALAVFGLYMFVVHSATNKHAFIDIRLFKDVTFMSATTIMFLVFMIYLGALVLLPQMLQLEFNYPVLAAGIATTPRGIGMLIAMFTIGRLGNHINPRTVIFIGMACNGLSLYLMSRWSLNVSMHDIAWTGVLQGLGMGALTLPIATLAFSTLSAELRNDGTAFFNLMRNLGGAVGVAIVSSRLVELTQIQHGYLTEFMTPFRHLLPQTGIHGGAAAMMLMNLDPSPSRRPWSPMSTDICCSSLLTIRHAAARQIFPAEIPEDPSAGRTNRGAA